MGMRKGGGEEKVKEGWEERKRGDDGGLGRVLEWSGGIALVLADIIALQLGTTWSRAACPNLSILRTALEAQRPSQGRLRLQGYYVYPPPKYTLPTLTDIYNRGEVPPLDSI